MTRYTGAGSKNSSYIGILEIEQGSQDIPGNYTNVNWKLYLKTGGSYYSQTGTTCKVVIDNVVVFDDYQQRSVSANKENLLASGSLKVSHNPAGDKTVPVSASIVTTASYSYLPGECKMSGNFSLTTIPRSSDFGNINGDVIGNTITVSILSHYSSFIHTFWYRLTGTTEWIMVGEGYETSLSFTPPMSLCYDIPNSSTGTLEMCLRTMDGDKIIGDDVYKSITVNVPDNVVPYIGGITVSEAISNVKDKAGVYVQSLSKLNIAIANASGAYGSTIKSYLIKFEDVNYASQSTVSDYIKGSGYLSAVGIVTDSRGRTYKRSLTFSVAAYSPPAFSKAPTAERLSIPTNVRVISSGSVSSIKNGSTEKNHLKLYVLYKKSSTSSYPSISDSYKVLDTTTLSFSNAVKTLTSIAESTSYNIKVVLMDIFKETSWELSLGTEIVGYDFNRYGLGINKFREQGALDVNGDIYMNNVKVAIEGHSHSWSSVTGKPAAATGTVDYIVEQGTYGIWTWRKWSNGVRECFGEWYGSYNTGDQNYSGYYYTTAKGVSYPPGLFSRSPLLFTDYGPTNIMCGVRAFSGSVNEAGFTIYAHGAYSGNCYVYLYAIGN